MSADTEISKMADTEMSADTDTEMLAEMSAETDNFLSLVIMGQK